LRLSVALVMAGRWATWYQQWTLRLKLFYARRVGHGDNGDGAGIRQVMNNLLFWRGITALVRAGVTK